MTRKIILLTYLLTYLPTYLLGGLGGMERPVLVWKLDTDCLADLLGLSNLSSTSLIR